MYYFSVPSDSHVLLVGMPPIGLGSAFWIGPHPRRWRFLGLAPEHYEQPRIPGPRCF
jgi:hypothetical protein